MWLGWLKEEYDVLGLALCECDVCVVPWLSRRPPGGGVGAEGGKPYEEPCCNLERAGGVGRGGMSELCDAPGSAV